jgi:hypothetical protein
VLFDGRVSEGEASLVYNFKNRIICKRCRDIISSITTKKNKLIDLVGKLKSSFTFL